MEEVKAKVRLPSGRFAPPERGRRVRCGMGSGRQPDEKHMLCAPGRVG